MIDDKETLRPDLQPEPPLQPAEPPSRRIRWLLFWIGVAIVALVLLARPLRLHPLDRWIHGLVGHPEASPTKDLAPAGEAAAGTSKPGARKILFYRNPMNPSITSPVPAKDEMGMDFVPVYADEGTPAAAESAAVSVDPRVVQNMNVTTAAGRAARPHAPDSHGRVSRLRPGKNGFRHDEVQRLHREGLRQLSRAARAQGAAPLRHLLAGARPDGAGTALRPPVRAAHG